MARKLAPGQPVPLRFGPYRGMRDDLTPEKAAPEWASFLRNVRVRLEGEGVVARPGFLKGPKPATGEAQELIYAEIGGYQWLVAVVGGGVYTMDLSVGTWSANVKPVGVTVNATGRVFAEVFLDRIVISDGVNRPWKFNPADNTGAYLTDMATPAYGRPVVYAGKLFFIRTALPRVQICWGNEGDIDLGYAAALNNWELRQTSVAPLVCLVPTNAQLYYFREDSIGVINGTIARDFATATTQDAVDPQMGTLSPDGPTVVGDRIIFPDQTGQLRAVTIGGVGSAPLAGLRQTLQDVNKGRLASIWGAYLPAVEALVMAMPLSSGSTLNNDLVVLGGGVVPWGVWNYTAAQAIDFRVGTPGKDTAGRKVFYHLDADGDFYSQRALDQAAAAYDTVVTNALPLVEAVSGLLGYDLDYLKVLDSVALDTLRDRWAGVPTVSFDYLDAPSKTYVPAGRLVVATPAGPADTLARAEAGLNGFGRYAKVRLRNLDDPALVQHVYLGGELRAFPRPGFEPR